MSKGLWSFSQKRFGKMISEWHMYNGLEVGCILFVKMFIFCQNRFNRCSPNFCFWNSHIYWVFDANHGGPMLWQAEVQLLKKLSTGFHFFSRRGNFKTGDTYCSILSRRKRFSVFEPIYWRMWISLGGTFELDESSSRLGMQYPVRHAPTPVWRTLWKYKKTYYSNYMPIF